MKQNSRMQQVTMGERSLRERSSAWALDWEVTVGSMDGTVELQPSQEMPGGVP